MEIRESFRLPAPRDEAARTLLDVKAVAEMTNEFVGCVSARFEPFGQGSPPPQPRSSPAPPLRILRRAIGTWLRRLLGRADP